MILNAVTLEEGGFGRAEMIKANGWYHLQAFNVLAKMRQGKMIMSVSYRTYQQCRRNVDAYAAFSHHVYKKYGVLTPAIDKIIDSEELILYEGIYYIHPDSEIYL